MQGAVPWTCSNFTKYLGTMGRQEQDEEQALMKTWMLLKEPKPSWIYFKRFAQFTQGDTKKALDIWRRTKDR